MARKLRVQYQGAIYHVMNRGNHQEDIFLGDKDREPREGGEVIGVTNVNSATFTLCPLSVSAFPAAIAPPLSSVHILDLTDR